MDKSVGILVIEDDYYLNRAISFKLQKEGFEVFSAASLQEGRKLLTQHEIHLLILDVSLPDGNGFAFCREIRKNNSVLIIFLTACDQETDIVLGYDLGADDYLTKPFSLMVLISKIRALLRRSQLSPENVGIRSGDITFYPATMQLCKYQQAINLSKTELKLLSYFLNNPRQIITREQFLQHLWDSQGDDLDENTLAVNIRRLREKIEDDPSRPRYIKTVRGIGYIWGERCVSD